MTSPATLPMFPLPSPLLPGMGLPLQVFEPRYHELMTRVLEGDGHFGVSLITRGHQVGGGDLRSSVGTTAEILQHQQLEDGRRLVLAVGRHRLRVTRWLRDDPYPVADVEAWPDEPRATDVPRSNPDGGGRGGDTDPRRLGRIDVQARLDDIVAILADRLPDSDRDRLVESSTLPRDLDTAIWQATIVADLGALDRQRLLEAPGPDERVPLLVGLLEERRDVLAFSLADPP